MQADLESLDSKDSVPLVDRNPNFERMGVLVEILSPREATDADPVAEDRARARPGGALDRVAEGELELRRVRNY